MRTMGQSKRGQVSEGQGSVLWQGALVSKSDPLLEGAEEIDLLPEFEELLRDSGWEVWFAPAPEGLLG